MAIQQGAMAATLGCLRYQQKKEGERGRVEKDGKSAGERNSKSEISYSVCNSKYDRYCQCTVNNGTDRQLYI